MIIKNYIYKLVTKYIEIVAIEVLPMVVLILSKNKNYII